jgi:predicted lipoprotein with Yx(FWY)xxD motif
MRRIIVVVVVLAVGAVAVVIAGCGSGDSGSTGSSSSTSAASSSGAAAVKTADGLGAKLLVDGQGRTLYLFESDTSDTSTCSGACAQAWPPLTSKGAATASSGADTSMLGTITRADGSKQVTYAGHPLYLFSGDKQAGDTNGEGSDGFGAEWYALDPSGKAIESGGSSTGSSTGSSPSGY